MRRRRRAGLLLIVALVCAAILAAWFVHLKSEREASREREQKYESILHSYTVVILPGTTHNQVERYLGAKGIQFQGVCCSVADGAYEDLAKIGQEPSPWYCSVQNVYISFQFVSTDPGDRLRTIAIERRLVDCL